MESPKFHNDYNTVLGRPLTVESLGDKATNPEFVYINYPLAKELGINKEWFNTKEALQFLTGNCRLAEATPVAMAYAGHQFGNLVPQLGDGRALLLGELKNKNGELRDVHLKGSGPTIYSRGGDGKATIEAVLREVIISESMHNLGVPTSRPLAAIATGDSVYRDKQLPGAILVRVAKGHVRVGTFEYLAIRGEIEKMKALADYSIKRWYPQANNPAEAYRLLLREVTASQAKLMAKWIQTGFIHGVMNTDNTSISGETIDYGPCAFMDNYNHKQVYSSIDRHGRYAYANQPLITQWNLCRFAETLIPLLDENQTSAIDIAQQEIEAFTGLYESAWLDIFRQKIGLTTKHNDDKKLITRLLQLMEHNQADYTNSWRNLAEIDCQEKNKQTESLPGAITAPQIKSWLQQLRQRLAEEKLSVKGRKSLMNSVNPAIIPRNHHVHKALQEALSLNYQPFRELMKQLETPFVEKPKENVYIRPPELHEIIRETYCGT